MNKKFLSFIAQCQVNKFLFILYYEFLIKKKTILLQYFEDDNMELVKIGKLIPHPRINLAFENGKICFWNGK